MKLSLPPLLRIRVSLPGQRHFTTSPHRQAQNRIYDTSIRNRSDFQTALLASGANRHVLITFWSASWCPSCKVIAPLIKEVVEQMGQLPAGDGDVAAGGASGVGLVEVEMDAPGIAQELGVEYGITSIPTLLAFGPRRQEARFDTRVTDVGKMRDRGFLQRWVEEQVKREEGGGGGGAGGGGILGKLFS